MACIGAPPEHRDYRWEYLNGTKRYHQPTIEPTAIVEAFATVDGGITRRTYIGDHVMLMKHSHVGHDAVISANSNVAPGAIIGGFYHVGEGVKIGLGASIRPRVVIGEYAIIGAGAVVVKDVPPGETWAGNPAGPIRNKKQETPFPVTEWEGETDAWMEWYESWHHEPVRKVG